MNSDSIIQRNPDILASKLDEDYVMMDMESGRYIGTNPVAARIWELIEEPLSFEALIDALLKEYDISREQCIQDVSAFLKEALEQKLIILDDQ